MGKFHGGDIYACKTRTNHIIIVRRVSASLLFTFKRSMSWYTIVHVLGYCYSDQWECDNGYQCIDEDDRCDGHEDCLDGSDEDGCGTFCEDIFHGKYSMHFSWTYQRFVVVIGGMVLRMILGTVSAKVGTMPPY